MRITATWDKRRATADSRIQNTYPIIVTVGTGEGAEQVAMSIAQATELAKDLGQAVRDAIVHGLKTKGDK